MSVLYQILPAQHDSGNCADPCGKDHTACESETHMHEPSIDGRHGRDHHEHQHPVKKGQEDGQPAALPADDGHEKKDCDEHRHQKDLGSVRPRSRREST